MTLVRPAADVVAADWLLRPDVDWWDLVRYGPHGFEVYVRVALADDADGGPAQDNVRTALETLAGHTSSPANGYAAIWEGWGGGPLEPVAPRVAIPNREMLLFTGEMAVLRDAPELAWGGTGRDGVTPHLVWPEDRAWCLACEVDEEIEFSVGCAGDAARALEDALPGLVRRVGYGERASLYRDE